MKVLLVADAVGGVFIYAVELSRALAAHGVEVVLATEGARLAADQRRAIEGIPGLVHEESGFRLEWMEDPWEDVAASGRWLLELEARHRPDVVHTNELAHGALPFVAPKLVVGHSCVLSWFEAVRRAPAPPAWDRYRRVVGEGLRGADALAAPSAAMAAALVRHHGPLPAPIVISNGRDPLRFTPGSKEPRVLGAGRLWDEAKNAAALARVAPRLPWPVFIAGDTAPPGTKSHLSTSSGTVSTSSGTASTSSGTVSTSSGTEPGTAQSGREAPTFLGRLSEAEMAHWLGTAAIFAHPARYEPFGLAVLEAALSGCALVLGDIPSLRETWEGAAEFVAPDDDDALVERLDALAGHPERRAELARRARSRARRFTPDRMAARTLAVYRTLAARPARRRHGAHP